MTAGFEHRDRQGGDRELTRLAARERLAELCDSVRHACSVQGPFQPLGSLRPRPRAISGSDLAAGRSKEMEQQQCRGRAYSGWVAVDHPESSLPDQKGIGRYGGGEDGSSDGLAGDQPAWGCLRPFASLRLDPSSSLSSLSAQDLSVGGRGL